MAVFGPFTIIRTSAILTLNCTPRDLLICTNLQHIHINLAKSLTQI